MKNKIILLLLCFISVLLFACSKEESSNPLEVEPGSFKGYIGRHGYDLVNDKFNERVSITHFDGKNIQFQFKSDSSPSIIDGSIFEMNQLVTVNLVNPLKTSSFLFFNSYIESKNYIKNWITVDWFEQLGEQKTKKFYTTVKDKQSVEAEILSVKYKELRIPSFEVKIRGYLYNIENKKDSTLIDATFITQASH